MSLESIFLADPSRIHTCLQPVLMVGFAELRGCSEHLLTRAQAFNNWYPPERYFYASFSLSDDIFGPCLGNSPFVSVITWVGVPRKTTKEFWEEGGWWQADELAKLAVIFWSSWPYPDVLLRLSFSKLIVYPKSQHFTLKYKCPFNKKWVVC